MHIPGNRENFLESLLRRGMAYCEFGYNAVLLHQIGFASHFSCSFCSSLSKQNCWRGPSFCGLPCFLLRGKLSQLNSWPGPYSHGWAMVIACASLSLEIEKDTKPHTAPNYIFIFCRSVPMRCVRRYLTYMIHQRRPRLPEKHYAFASSCRIL